jgi:hypothetical protein
MSYLKIDDAVKIIMSLRKGSCLCKFDISDSIGRRASNLTVSNTIPKYSKHVTGPTVVCAAIGILSLLNVLVIIAIILSAIAFGDSTVKKSSSKCRMFLMHWGKDHAQQGNFYNC